MTQTLYGVFATLAVLLLITSTSFSQKHTDIDSIGKRDINRGELRLMTMSLEDEMKLGRQLSMELEQSVELLEVPAITEYVDRVGQSIARNSDLRIPVTIKVMDSPEINATALPGGFIYVNEGLITASGNEAELAAMIAHAVAHVAARHAAELHGRANALSVFPPPSSSFTVMPLSIPAQPVLPMSFAVHRADEEEADWLGLQYAYKAGYDPNAMVSFFEKMTALAPARQVSWPFTTHPSTEDRARKATANITRFLPPRSQNIVTTGEFDQVKAQLIALRPQ
jgi:predicted Zn-dependent protease